MTIKLALRQLKPILTVEKTNYLSVYSRQHLRLISCLIWVSDIINQTPHISTDDIVIPTIKQFENDQKFKVLQPKHSENKFYIGNCTRCGISIKYTRNRNCVTCRKMQRKYELYTSAKDRNYNQSVLIMAKIYCILQHDKHGIIYTGSTHYALQERKTAHKSSSIKRPELLLYSYISANGGWDNFYFKTIYEYPIGSVIKKQDRDQLHLIEAAYINDLKPICNQLTPMAFNSIRAKKVYENMCIDLNRIERTYKQLTKLK